MSFGKESETNSKNFLHRRFYNKDIQMVLKFQEGNHG